VTDGHHTHHHQHETTDAFAEGWEAREKALPNETVANPYRVEMLAIALKGTKRAKRQVEARVRDVELWDQGWNESAEAIENARKGKT
jgi:hypothetical protein